ncbi:GNAT family N-acetyltransferase [Streptacidiphilus sp. PAMC 29251]
MAGGVRGGAAAGVPGGHGHRSGGDHPGGPALPAEPAGPASAAGRAGRPDPRVRQLRPGAADARTPAHRSAPGEVYALYAHPEAWSTGIGARLLTAARDRLRADGREQAVLWVLAANTRARAFYERQGWRPTGGCGELRLGGAVLPELQYGTAKTGCRGRPPARAGYASWSLMACCMALRARGVSRASA